MGGEGRDRRYITASKGMGSRYLMVERSGQNLEFVKKKKTIPAEEHFDKTEYWICFLAFCYIFKERIGSSWEVQSFVPI